jgi:hypothetical protein
MAGACHAAIFLCAAVMLCCVSASAQDGKTDKNGVIEKPVLADTPDKFAEQTQRIHEDMQVGGRYEFTSPTDRKRVDALLGQMASLLQVAGSVDAMNHDTRIVLFNAQEEVNGLLKHNDSNRLVCESRAPIGSNILRTVCHTHGQIETTARNTKAGLQEFDHSRLCNSSNPTSSCMPTNTRNGH